MSHVYLRVHQNFFYKANRYIILSLSTTDTIHISSSKYTHINTELISQSSPRESLNNIYYRCSLWFPLSAGGWTLLLKTLHIQDETPKWTGAKYDIKAFFLLSSFHGSRKCNAQQSYVLYAFNSVIFLSKEKN